MYNKNYIFQRHFLGRLMLPVMMLIGGIICIAVYSNIAPTVSSTNSNEAMKNALVFAGVTLLCVGGCILTIHVMWNVILSVQAHHYGKFFIPIIALIAGVASQNCYYLVDGKQEMIGVFAFGALSLFCFAIAIVWLVSFLLWHIISAIRSKDSVRIHKNT